MFEHIQAGSPDPILSLAADFKADPSESKVNVAVGIYHNESGSPENLTSVFEARNRITQANSALTYHPITGSTAYLDAVKSLVFQDLSAAESENVLAMQAPGGTGALRIAGEFFKKFFPDSQIWISNPSWPIHNDIFNAVNLRIEHYPYYDRTSHALLFDELVSSLQSAKAKDIVLVHGCCHNPTGVDPSTAQWESLAKLAKDKGLMVLVDLAYQGFAKTVREDVTSVKAFIEAGVPTFVASSYSKNFGLYNQRVGALSVYSQEGPAVLENIRSQCAKIIRGIYSNPPAHGANVVATIYHDDSLRAKWLSEVDTMRERLTLMRELLVAELATYDIDASHIRHENGMFSILDLSPEDVQTLREAHHVYLVGSGRINVAGLTRDNVGYFAKAVASVMNGR